MTINPSAGTGPELEWFRSGYGAQDGQGPRLVLTPDRWAGFVSYAADHHG